MLTPSPFALLILLYGSIVFTTDSDPNDSSTTCWPKLNRDPPWGNLRGGLSYVYGDDCPNDAFLVPTFPDELDMMKMMGRWFDGMVSKRYPYHHPSSRKCIIHEFGRLIYDHNSTLFNVTLTYQASTHKIGHNKTWKNPEKLIGFMRSCGPINAKLMYKTSPTERPRSLETKFFIYKVGPDGKDSFGRPKYEYAVIGGCEKHPVLVIVRNLETFNDEHKKEVTKWLDDNGILRLWDWIQPDYSECSLDSETQRNETSDIRSEEAA